MISLQMRPSLAALIDIGCSMTPPRTAVESFARLERIGEGHRPSRASSAELLDVRAARGRAAVATSCTLGCASRPVRHGAYYFRLFAEAGARVRGAQLPGYMASLLYALPGASETWLLSILSADDAELSRQAE